MDFKDWRVNGQQPIAEEKQAQEARRRRRFSNSIEEQIREAQERGDFDNLPGMGRPLNLSDNTYEGENALGYHLLKNNGYAPPEVELAKEIRLEIERLDRLRTMLSKRGSELRRRRVPPFPSEKRSYNHAVASGLHDYGKRLRELNKKILTLNITAPAALHQPMLDIELLLRQFQEACPLFVQ